MDEIEVRRSKVRRSVTYWAGMFLFGGGYLFVGALWWVEQYDMAKDLFLAVLAPATAVVTYWFSSRQASKNETSPEERQGPQQEGSSP